MLAEMWQAFLFSLTIMFPNMVMLGLGYWLRQRKRISDEFTQQGARLVFTLSLPALLFLNIYNSHIDVMAQFSVVATGLITTLILFFGAELYAGKRLSERRERGIFVQGVFRGNLGIIGLSLCANAYGSEGIAVVSVYVAVITILFNVLAVITLTKSLTHSEAIGVMLMLKNIVKNPLILAISTGFLVKFIDVPLPQPVLLSGEYLAKMTLPLALICAGASLDFRRVENASTTAIQATIGRVFVAPLLAVGIGLTFGLSGVSLGVVFLMTITPAAAASYPMVSAFGGNAKMAANIIGLSTIGSLFFGVIGLTLLRHAGMI